jgi:hypothetical protein
VSGADPTGLSTRPLAAICPAAELGEEGAALLDAAEDAAGFIALLVERDHLPVAIRFLAHALSKPDAVWWASECARIAMDGSESPEDREALAATQRWVAEPSEENRRAAQHAAEAASPDSPAGMVGLAAFFSGGSVTPPGAPAIAPEEHLTGTMAATAVMLAAAKGDPEEAPSRYKMFLEGGMGLAQG